MQEHMTLVGVRVWQLVWRVHRMHPFSSLAACIARWGVPFVLIAQLTGVTGCTGYEGADGQSRFELQAEAVQLWAESEEPPFPTSQASEMRAESPTAVWLTDRITGGVLRVDPTRLDYRAMGVADTPPAEIVRPLRVAVSRQHGVFVFDLATRRVDQFTPDGTPVQHFEPGFVPSRMDVVDRPIALQFAVVDGDRPDSIPRLMVIRTDLRGANPDTVLSPGTHGPEALWNGTAQPGYLAIDAGSSGLWIWASVAADTVFEITADSNGRKRLLRQQDQDPRGIMVDSEREILWIVSPDEAGQLRYAAYDIRTPGLVEPEVSFLGERTTTGFDPKIAIDGVVVGRIQSSRVGTRLAAYDMLVPLKR
jgi:hypothetical protein